MTDDQREKDIDRLIEDIEAEKKARGSGRRPIPFRRIRMIGSWKNGRLKCRVSGWNSIWMGNMVMCRL